MAIHSVTQSRCRDGALSIAVQDTAIVIGVSGTDNAGVAAFVHATSTEARRTAYALLTAAEDLDEIERTRAGSEVPAHVEAEFPDEGNRPV